MKKQSNIWLGIALIIIAVLVIIGTLKFPSFVSAGRKLPGPNFVPNILSVVLIICGIYEIITYFVKKEPLNKSDVPIEGANRWGNQNVVIILLSLIIYVPLVQKLGFVITTFLFSLIIMIRLKVNWLRGTIISALLVIFIVLLFTKLFKVPLPEGLLTINF